MVLSTLLRRVREDSCFVNSSKVGPPSFEAYMGAVARCVGETDGKDALRTLAAIIMEAAHAT